MRFRKYSVNTSWVRLTRKNNSGLFREVFTESSAVVLFEPELLFHHSWRVCQEPPVVINKTALQI